MSIDTICSPGKAVSWFCALRESTKQLCSALDIGYLSLGGKHYSQWMNGVPSGLTPHYTAGPSWRGTLRWLSSLSARNKVSCHFLVLDRMIPEAEVIYAQYPELADLDSTVFMIADWPLMPAWHAGWVNRISVGIENRNAGMLRGGMGDWCWWANGWRAKFPHEQLGKDPIELHGRWWEPYTSEQIEANVLIGQYLHSAYQDDGGLDPAWIVPHSATTATKSDTGPCFPIHHVRDAIMSGEVVYAAPWMLAFDAAPKVCTLGLFVEEDDLFYRAVEDRQDDRAYGEIREATPSVIRWSGVPVGGEVDARSRMARGLHHLGYYVPGYLTLEAVRQFQRAHQLLPDGVVGSLTTAAFVKAIANAKMEAWI